MTSRLCTALLVVLVGASLVTDSASAQRRPRLIDPDRPRCGQPEPGFTTEERRVACERGNGACIYATKTKLIRNCRNRRRILLAECTPPLCTGVRSEGGCGRCSRDPGWCSFTGTDCAREARRWECTPAACEDAPPEEGGGETGLLETCDGADNDGDGRIDEGCSPRGALAADTDADREALGAFSIGPVDDARLDGSPLVFARRYVSADHWAYDAGRLGPGWFTPFDARVVDTARREAPGDAQDVLARFGDGSIERFVCAGQPGCVGDAGSTLSRSALGVAVERRDGSAVYFDRDAGLAWATRDAAGRGVTFSRYTRGALAGLVSRMDDEAGRSLVPVWEITSAQNVRLAQLSDESGHVQVAYEHDAAGLFLRAARTARTEDTFLYRDEDALEGSSVALVAWNGAPIAYDAFDRVLRSR